MNHILPGLVAFLAALLPSCLFAATNVNGDITTSTTWNAAGSPYLLNNSVFGGGDITVRNGATLTIDTTDGNVVIEWVGGSFFGNDFDLVVGNGSSQQGTLVIKAASGTVDFKVKTGGNIRVKNNGQLRWADTTAATTFTRYNSSNTWGAIVFEAGQTRQSEVRKSTFSYGGNDSKTAMIVIEDNEDYVPYLEDLTFSNQPTSGIAAVRMNGKGINTLKQGNVVMPFDVSGLDYVFHLNAVTSTAEAIRFPDVDAPSGPTNYLAGTCTVGGASNISHWRFDDAYTFKCANSSLINVVRGSIWGTEGSRPEFISVQSSPGYTNWTGLRDNGTTYDNVFGGIGPFAFLAVRNASFGVDVDKYHASASPLAGKTMRLPGIIAKRCDYGIRLKNSNTGTILLEGADSGGVSTDANQTRCLHVSSGNVIIDNCDFKGLPSTGTMIMVEGVNSQGYDVAFKNSRVTGAASTGIEFSTSQGSASAAFERSSVSGTTAAIGTAIYVYQSATYAVARSFTMSHSYVTASSAGLSLDNDSSGMWTVLVEDSTFADGGTYGMYCAEVRSGSTVVARRSTFFSWAYGAYQVNATNNTCEYTFEECYFTENGYGIRDDRTQVARVVASRCTIRGNVTNGAYDANTNGASTTKMQAQNCFWGSEGGPGTSGSDTVGGATGAVEFTPHLQRPYFDFLIGGSPATATTVEVRESAGTGGDALHIKSNTPYFAWAFGSDFAGATQYAFEVDVSTAPNFSSFVWDGSKTISTATGVTCGVTLTDGVLYFVRVRLWAQDNRYGPWQYRAFRLNTPPDAVGNTGRLPANTASLSDWTPVFEWVAPVDAENDPLHFTVTLLEEVAPDFWLNLSPVYDSREFTFSDGGFEVSTDDGVTWSPFPMDGAPSAANVRVRLTVPSLHALDNSTDLGWRVRATDGFELSGLSTLYTFSMSREYTISGQLQNEDGAGLNSKTVRLYINGEDSGITDTTATDGVAGRFDLVTTAGLKVGDVLWVYVDGETEKGAAVFHFTGETMTWADHGLVVRDKRVGVYGTVPGLVFDNEGFEIVNADADIPWTYSTGTVTFKSTINGTGDGLHLHGQWDLTGHVDGVTSLDTELRVGSTGHLRTQGHSASFHSFTNAGTLEVLGGSQLTLDGANSVSTGTLIVRDSGLRLQKSDGLTLTIENGVCELVRATLDVNTGDVSWLAVDSAKDSMAVLSCIGSTFSKFSLDVRDDGVVAKFDDNSFEDGNIRMHINWGTTDVRSIGTMRNIQFNFAFEGGYSNVAAESNAVPLLMVGCGGIRSGSTYEYDPGNKVAWEPTPPTGLKVLTGNTRLRLEWDESEQAALSGAGYNVYRTTNPADALPWGTPLNGGTPITDTFYNDTSLTNGTTYYYYVTVDDGSDESGGSKRVNAKPAAAALDAISPESGRATSVVTMTLFGDATHWDGTSVASITKTGGGSNLTINDTIVVSPTLILLDVTLDGATVGDWNVAVETDDVWGIGAYDESVGITDGFAVLSDSDETRPTISFSAPTADANVSTAGTWTIVVDYSAGGGTIDAGTLELFASRAVTVQNTVRPAGTDLSAISGFWNSPPGSTSATCTVNNSAATELFSDGEYVLTARIANNNGEYSEYATRRFYVNGASANVVKVDHSSGTVVLLQGTTQTITLTGSSLSGAVDFGSGIDVISTSGSGSSMNVTLSVADLAACGPREFTTNGGSKTGVAVVEYPTNLLPTVTNAEPSRNPAIAGVNVFLANGAFFKGETDIATRGRMMGMSWSRFYRSDVAANAGYNGPLGHGWIGHYFQRTKLIIGGFGDKVEWYTPDGRREDFVFGVGSYTPPTGVYVMPSIEPGSGLVTLTDRHGYSCKFNAQGRLWRCIDRNGNMTECIYNYAGQLVEIVDDRGFSWEIEYHDHGRVSKVIDKVWDDTTPREVEYDYDSWGNLVRQKAPETDRYTGGNRITYAYRYDASNRLTECINPREFNESSNPVSYMENFYDASGRVVDQRLGTEADVQDAHLTRSSFIRLRYESGTLIRELDRNGLRTDYTIDGSGRATDIKRFTGFWSVDTDFPYDHSAKTEEVAKLRSSDPTSFDTAITYNSNHEVLAITYPRGNKVTYTYPNATAGPTGTATSCSGATLTDTGASFGTLAGHTLRMGTSAASYRYYPIASNTGTTITVATGFDLQADGWDNDTYAVFDTSDDHLAAGNVLEVRRSDESLGSLPDIVTEYTYEPRYQFVKTVKDPRGHVSTYTYDYEVSDANGRDAGNLVMVESPNITDSMPSGSITTRTSYNEFGQPVAMIDGMGNVSRFVYYSSGATNGFLKHRISAWGELNLTSEYDYDRVGNLIASWSPRAFEGGTKDDFKTAYTVNELNQTWHVVSKYEIGDINSSNLASIDSYRYFDANGNLTNSLREYVTFDNNSPSAPGNIHDPSTFSKASSAMAATWVESSFEYNLLNYTTARTVDAVAGSSVTRLTSRTEYDSNYNVLSSISPLGNRSRSIYDERDMVFKRIAGADSDVAATFESDYDANGNVIKSRDALGNESQHIYDGFDRTIKTTDAAGHYRTTEYDANSNVLESKAFDKFDRLLAHGKTTYDQINRAWKSERLANDHLGVPIGDGWNTSVTVFDKNSRVVSGTNDNGVTYFNFYDAANRTTFTRDAVGNEAHFNYNLNSATTRVDYREINGLNGAIEISHVEYVLNRSDAAFEVRDRRWSSSFDTASKPTRDGWGRVVSSEDPATNTVTTNYDLLSRVTDSTQEAGTDDIHTRFGYDDDSRTILRGIRRNPAESTYQETEYLYDERSRLITLRHPDGDIWNFKYDANGNQLGWDDPLGTTVVNTYDQRNLVAYRHITRGTGIVGTDYESYEFDGLGRLQSNSNYADGNLISASAWHYNSQSQPERHDQTIADYEGTILGTWTTYAEYDASGFNTASINSNGRRVSHHKDNMDRLLSSYDESNSLQMAAYVYRGPGSIVERVFGNGTRTKYTYEESGCGCGGSSGFIERVEHIDANTGRVLWATDRRHDVRGLVTAERRDHEGASGNVFRYDEAARLTKTFYGVNLFDTGLDTYANPASLPTSYGKLTSYELDPRSNRTSVKEYDDAFSPVEIYDYSYTANADTNQYTAIDGESYSTSFDAIEQMVFDPARNLNYGYDYKGQIIYEDRAADTPGTPERRYTYDNMGRRKTEAQHFEASDHRATLSVFVSAANCLACAHGGCGGNTGDQPFEEHTYLEDGTLWISNYPLFGPGAVGGLSGSAVHPATVALPPGADAHGPLRVLEYITPKVGADKWHFRYEDQLGSLIGMANHEGTKLADYTYLDYGRPIERRIAFDGDINLVVPFLTLPDTPVTGQTTIALSSALLDTDQLKGMQIAIALPEYGEFWVETVLSNTTNTIVVDDASYLIYSGIDEGLSFVVYDFVDTNVHTSGSYHTAGTWTSAPGFGSSVTTFTDSGADFQAHMIGWLVSPTVENFANIEIIGVTATTLTVNGDARGLGANGGRYWVFAPPHVNPANGAIRGDYDDDLFIPECDTRYLWALYRYMPPMAGFEVDLDGPGPAPAAIYGRQTGTNQSGHHHAQNRVYDPATGRWTTTDPVASPWWNLWSYVNSRPHQLSDPTGLLSIGQLPATEAAKVPGYMEVVRAAIASNLWHLVHSWIRAGGALQVATELVVAERIAAFAANKDKFVPVPAPDPAPVPAPISKPTPRPQDSTPKPIPPITNPKPNPGRPSPPKPSRWDPKPEPCPDVDDPIPDIDKDDPGKPLCTCEWARDMCIWYTLAGQQMGIDADMDICEEAFLMCLADRAKLKLDCWPHGQKLLTKNGNESTAPDYRALCPTGVK